MSLQKLDMGQDPPQKKRKLASSASKSIPKKRKTGQLPGKPKPKNTKRPVDVNALAWRNVEVPEMFDDAEGFFGLEEVEGVDVVRDGATVRFVRKLVPSRIDQRFLTDGFR